MAYLLSPSRRMLRAILTSAMPTIARSGSLAGIAGRMRDRYAAGTRAEVGAPSGAGQFDCV